MTRRLESLLEVWIINASLWSPTIRALFVNVCGLYCLQEVTVGLLVHHWWRTVACTTFNIWCHVLSKSRESILQQLACVCDVARPKEQRGWTCHTKQLSCHMSPEVRSNSCLISPAFRLLQTSRVTWLHSQIMLQRTSFFFKFLKEYSNHMYVGICKTRRNNVMTVLSVVWL